MLDKLLNIGAAFDWITPSVAFTQDFLNFPIGDFGIPVNAYWDKKKIKRLLSHYGVHAWGFMFNFDGDVLLFTVRRHQAALTFHILQDVGVPIIYAPVDAM